MNLNQNKNHSFKTSRQLERHFKGIANHRRIDALMLIHGKPSLTLDQICENLDCNYQTLAEHMARLVRAGLVFKKNRGSNVEHSVTPYGKKICKFIEVFSCD